MADYLAKMLKGGSAADDDGQTLQEKKLQKQLKRQAKKMKNNVNIRSQSGKNTKYRLPKKVAPWVQNRNNSKLKEARYRIESTPTRMMKTVGAMQQIEKRVTTPVSNYNTSRIDSDSDSDDAAPPRRKVAEDNMVSSKQKGVAINGVWTRTRNLTATTRHRQDASPR